uniref:Uncharacterized protein n=1 Tax=Panagrolaimus sp. JU765 TaxID=591449 RepID=A0AC34QXT5_9BILA
MLSVEENMGKINARSNLGYVTKIPLILVVDIFGKVLNILDQSEVELLPFLNETKGATKGGSVELVASDSSLPIDVTKIPLILVVDIFGKVLNILDQSEVELLPFLNETKGVAKDGSVELVASDSSLPIGEIKTSEFYLSTCWVVYDDHFIPERYFAAFFKIIIEKNKMIANLWQKFPISTAPTFCRLTKTSPIATDELYLLIFSCTIGVQAFSIDSESQKIDLLENIGDVFPVFEIRTLPGAVTRSHCWITKGYRFSVVGFDTGFVVASSESQKIDLLENIGDVFPVFEIRTLPGAVTRSHCWITKGYRFSVVGFDTGFVVASVCTMHSGTIIDQRSIKFSGPISVLKLIETDEERLETCVMISSTLGPVVIWTLGLVDEYLQWKMKYELAESENYDSIITGNTNHEFIFIGTFFDYVLIYELSTLKTSQSVQIPLLSKIHVGSPILSINYVPVDDTYVLIYELSTLKTSQSVQIPLLSKIHVGSPILSINYVPVDDTVVILSTKGFYRFVQKGNKIVDVIDGEFTEVREKPLLDLNKFAPLD